MKLTVQNKFRDKYDHVTEYPKDTILDVQDEERAADLVKRGLCSEYKGKKKAVVTLAAAEPQPTEKPEDNPVADGSKEPADGGEKAKSEGKGK